MLYRSLLDCVFEGEKDRSDNHDAFDHEARPLDLTGRSRIVGGVAHSPALLEERELRPTVKTGERCWAFRGAASKTGEALVRIQLF